MSSPSGAPDPGVSPSLSARLDLPLGPEAAALARRTLRDVLTAWSLAADEAWVYDAQLVVSELVGNAVAHGGDAVVLEVEDWSGAVVLSVADGSAVLPESRQPGDEDERGRGMAIVEALAREWGVEQRGGGKRVWARLARPAGAQ